MSKVITPGDAKAVEAIARRLEDDDSQVRQAAVEGTRLPFPAEAEIRALDEATLHVHAMLLYRTLGANKVGQEVPLMYEPIWEWALQHQRPHLAPLRGAFTGASSGTRGGP